MPKGKYIDLQLSGRKLLSAPEGYTARSEGQVKLWLKQLPESWGEGPLQVQTHLRCQCKNGSALFVLLIQ
jgi:hypothetical protein